MKEEWKTLRITLVGDSPLIPTKPYIPQALLSEVLCAIRQKKE